MIEVKDKLHRIMAPRLILLIGTTSEDGIKNIIPINNVSPVSTDPAMVMIAVYKEWQTCANLKTGSGFTLSVPSREHLELVWKLGAKYSGYKSGLDKNEEFKESLDNDFSEYGPVLKNAIGWLECGVINLPEGVGSNHLMAIGRIKRGFVDPKQYKEDITPIGNPKPIMQWQLNNFSEASDIFAIDYYKEPLK